MKPVARRTILMLAGALTLCTTMISVRETRLDDDVGGILAATSVEASVTADVVGGQLITALWAGLVGICGNCLLMIAFGNAPTGMIVPCAHVCSLVLG